MTSKKPTTFSLLTLFNTWISENRAALRYSSESTSITKRITVFLGQHFDRTWSFCGVLLAFVNLE
jgi:hypothetical protein